MTLCLDADNLDVALQALPNRPATAPAVGSSPRKMPVTADISEWKQQFVTTIPVGAVMPLTANDIRRVADNVLGQAKVQGGH